jgi:hypothetical protein
VHDADVSDDYASVVDSSQLSELDYVVHVVAVYVLHLIDDPFAILYVQPSDAAVVVQTMYCAFSVAYELP